jgi:DNA repair and recombination RAD54-like protein
MKGLDKNCSAVEKNLSLARAKQLMETINPFILRRTGNILSKFLPAKHEYSVFIKMTPLQEQLYNRVIDSRGKGFLSDGKSESYGEIFSILTVLRKILNHPKLLSSIDSKYAQEAKGGLPENFWDEDLTYYSAKFKFLESVYDQALQDDEKIVVVSYWTTTLDILAAWLKTKSQQYTRLDGSMNMKKRQKAIDIFNDRKSPYRTILLCAKAGGVGLNLTSGNRMVLFDADWNPSWDLQVMGRIWREGQLKTVHIYRYPPP